MTSVGICEFAEKIPAVPFGECVEVKRFEGVRRRGEPLTGEGFDELQNA